MSSERPGSRRGSAPCRRRCAAPGPRSAVFRRRLADQDGCFAAAPTDLSSLETVGPADQRSILPRARWVRSWQNASSGLRPCGPRRHRPRRRVRGTTARARFDTRADVVDDVERDTPASAREVGVRVALAEHRRISCRWSSAGGRRPDMHRARCSTRWKASAGRAPSLASGSSSTPRREALEIGRAACELAAALDDDMMRSGRRGSNSSSARASTRGAAARRRRRAAGWLELGKSICTSGSRRRS